MSEYIVPISLYEHRQLKRLSGIDSGGETTKAEVGAVAATNRFLEYLTLGLALGETTVVDLAGEPEVELVVDFHNLEEAAHLELTAYEYGIDPVAMIQAGIMHAIADNHKALQAETAEEVALIAKSRADLATAFYDIVDRF